MAQSPKKDGLYEDVPFTDYLAWKAINASTLKMLKVSALEMKMRMDNPLKETSDLKIGHAVHAAILQPDIFESDYIEMPVFGDCRTPANKKAKDEWFEKNKDITSLDSGEWDTVTRCVKAIQGHKLAMAVLNQPKSFKELSVIWTDKETGLRCKGRLDCFTRFSGQPIVPDIKTFRDAPTESNRRREITRRGYHQSVAFYLKGLETISKSEVERQAWFIWVQKVAPYDVVAAQLNPDALREGRRDMEKYLRTYKECVDENRFQGIASDLQEDDIEAWAYTSGSKGYE